MNRIGNVDEIDAHRRRFFGAAAMAAAAAQFGMSASAPAQAAETATPASQAGRRRVLRPAEADRRRRAECRLCRSRPRQWSGGHSSAWLALRHPQLCRCRAVAGLGGLSRDRPVSARLWHDAVSCRTRHVRNGQPSAVAVDIIALMDALKIDKAIARRLRLGRAHRQHRRGALAGALQGDGLGQRLSDRQPGGGQDAVAAGGRAAMVVSVLFRHRARARRL